MIENKIPILHPSLHHPSKICLVAWATYIYGSLLGNFNGVNINLGNSLASETTGQGYNELMELNRELESLIISETGE